MSVEDEVPEDEDGLIPSTLSQKIGDLSNLRGMRSELQLVSCDVVPFCNPNICKAAGLCNSCKDPTRKCLVLLGYMKSVIRMIWRNFGEELTEVQLFKVGMHILPLYKILGRLKLEEAGTEEIVDVDNRGRKYINPIFKEIRETIKIIEFAWEKARLPVIESGDADVPFEELGQTKRRRRKLE